MYWFIYRSQINSLTLGFGVIACANEMLKSINLLVIITFSFTALKTRKQQKDFVLKFQITFSL